MTTAKTNLIEPPSLVDLGKSLPSAAAVVAAPGLAVEVGMGGTYVLVGRSIDVELVGCSETPLVVLEAMAVPQC